MELGWGSLLKEFLIGPDLAVAAVQGVRLLRSTCTRPKACCWFLGAATADNYSLPRKRKYTKREGGAGKAGQRGRARRLTEGLALGPRP